MVLIGRLVLLGTWKLDSNHGLCVSGVVSPTLRICSFSPRRGGTFILVFSQFLSHFL